MAELEINANNKIFEGHFPGQPVTPGVCMMQMVKEITEKAIGIPTQLNRADEMKFLSIIDPTKNNRITAEIKYALEDNKAIVTASLSKDTTTHFKFKGSFLLQSSPAN
jgi:3-hydroxyacyl-[acyl-carrier-protein] dehydratase